MNVVLLGLIFTLTGVVIGALITAAYLQSRYRAIRNAVGKGSFEAVFRLLNEESRYISLLDDALRALDVVQDEVSTTRTRVADTIEWIKNTTVGRVGRAGRTAAGMIKQGRKRTLGELGRSVEVHLFGVDADLYGKWVRVEWLERLRDVERFGSAAELRTQIERDRHRALDALIRHGPQTDKSRASHA